MQQKKPKFGESLAEKNPKLAKEWHPTKNGKLRPQDVYPGTSKKAWWKCPRGDDHEWEAPIGTRNHGRGCPFCSGRKVTKSTSLSVLNTELAKEWHPIKNGNLTPENIHPGSNKKVWWRCPNGDDHEWKTSVAHRQDRKHGCPFCSGHKVTRSTSLAVLNPELAKEWHPTKNGELTPYHVSPGSGKKVWWKCPKGDDHEWEAFINNRNKGIGCPICSNKKTVKSKSLAIINPSLSKEWHPTKNGELTPYHVTPSSGKKVWWQCKHGHEWKTSVSNRKRGTGCPKCGINTSDPELRVYCELKTLFQSTQHQAVIKNYEVDIYIPEIQVGVEYDGEYWHRNKTIKDQKKNKALESTLFLLRIREKGLPKIISSDIQLKTSTISIDLIKNILKIIKKYRKIEEVEVLNKINNYLKRDKWIASAFFKKLQSEKNHIDYEKSISCLFPDIAKEWHPIKNNPLLPDFFLPGSNKKVWWKCPKGEDHEWKSAIVHRCINFAGCPVCSNQKVVKSNCLGTLNPKLAKEWHPTKNGILTPNDVTPGSNKKVWWKCKYGHEWKTSVEHRQVRKQGCPFCSNRKIIKSNSLATLNPKLANEWHPTKNGNLTPNDVGIGLNKRVWWKCPKDDDHEWKTSVIGRVRTGSGCPFCAGQKATKKNSLALLNPKLAKEWHPTKNGNLTPYDVMPGSGKKVWWKCPKGEDHEWETSPRNRKKGDNCPICSNRKVVKSNCLATLYPKLSKEWHPTKNGILTPNDVVPSSNKVVWWKNKDRYEWKAAIVDRTKAKSKSVSRIMKIKKSPGQLDLL